MTRPAPDNADDACAHVHTRRRRATTALALACRLKHGRSRPGLQPTGGSPAPAAAVPPAPWRSGPTRLYQQGPAPRRSPNPTRRCTISASNINRVVLTGNLTRDPELRSLQSGTKVCSLRIATNSRRRTNGGEWVDKPNYFSVTVWGAQGENCHRYLSKGRPVCIDGRLDWREWVHDDSKREAIEIVAESVQFLAAPNGNSEPKPDPAPAAGTADADDIAF
jgi:single-strand DNA-binding protein